MDIPGIPPNSQKKAISNHQKVWADQVIKGETRIDAAKVAYPNQNYNSQRQMVNKNWKSVAVQHYMQEKMLKREIVDEGVDTLREAMKANKVILDKFGEIVDAYPDWNNRIKAALGMFKLLEGLTGGGQVSKEDVEVAVDDYWRERFHQEVGHDPTMDELNTYRTTIEVEPEEVQQRLFSADKRVVDLRPSTFEED